MLSRQHRFHGHNSLRYVYKQGQIVRDQSLALKYLLNPRRKTYRVAVVVSRQVNKSAVVRNRLRRRLYEVVRSYDNAISKPYDLVYTVFSDHLSDVPPEQLDKCVRSQLQKADVISSAAKPHHDIVEEKES